MMEITENSIQVEKLYNELYNITCGAVVTFEGRVRNHNDLKQVVKLEYECYYPMAMKVLEEIKNQALKKWNIKKLIAVHRIGEIPIGEIAVWIGVASVHRKESFEACQFVINEIKHKVPIWKRETYFDGLTKWVECDNKTASPVKTLHAQSAFVTPGT